MTQASLFNQDFVILNNEECKEYKIDVDTEIWKPIKNYENLYLISNWGRIKNLLTGKMLKISTIGGGYKYVSLAKGNKRKGYYLHRLVAEAFCPNPYNFPIVNHKDENPENCKASNLEWCSYHYNNSYGSIREKRRKKYQNVAVISIEDNGTETYFNSITEAQKQGYQGTIICMCCKGKRKIHKGRQWRYATLKEIKKHNNNIII